MAKKYYEKRCANFRTAGARPALQMIHAVEESRAVRQGFTKKGCMEDSENASVV